MCAGKRVEFDYELVRMWKEPVDPFLRGGLGPGAEIGLPLLRRVPSSEAPAMVERLVGAWLDGRQNGETIQQFFHRKEDAELAAIAGWEIRERREREAA